MMKVWNFLFLVTFIISAVYCGYVYETKTFTTLLDHFNFVDDRTFSFRYLVNNASVSNDKSPILFYAGNEGDIELFAENTGFIWKIAPKLGALIVFAEHRYYGKSLPFGNESYKDPQHLGYLTSEQALADYADLLKFLNPEEERPVIAFGGSYGGMLAAWFRMKYPHLVTGALASSAPVLQFPGVVPCDIFNRILTSVFKVALDRNPDGTPQSICIDNIKKSWTVLQNYSSNDEGRKFLNQKFKFCTAMNKTEDWNTFYDYLQDVLGNLAMANYPYPANFLADLPAYPVREFCGQLNKEFPKNEELINAFNEALQIYTNYTQKLTCLDISSAYASNLGSKGWDFQACTEMVMPTCANGTTDMFIPKKWDFKEYSDNCMKKFKVIPREMAAMTQYGGKRMDTASNIIFSNGLLDPWSGGGVLRSFNEKVDVIIIPEGAHHIDLRADNKLDPASVKESRKFYLEKFKTWINEFQTKM
ncbi:CLUMA_CG008164, isoform A [Clunio marinus]|uniref:Lysosomal Pro-X carboxypeptidase n=1 Tax=Clunio marinus TaxID=568069 RepID=A0A1J1I2X5_9DIPT|nr:CLUMA_CG008164, isoform A [Clunio marinus]